MNPSPPAPRRADVIDRLVLFGLLLAALAAGCSLQAALVDDAYIYLRIGANLGNGLGWTYNSGELANAATSATYTLLLTAVGKLVGYGPLALGLAWGIGLAGFACLQYLAWRPLYGRILALLIVALVAGATRLLESVGMETALLMALVTAVALAWQHRGDSWLTGVLVGLCMMTRPEGVLVAGLVGVVHLLHTRRMPWRSALAAALLVLPWLAFAHFYFGGVGSHTAAVKAAQRSYGWWATQPGFAVGWLQQMRWPWPSVALAAGGAALMVQQASQRQVTGIFCVAFGLLQVGAYQAMGAPAGYHWYYVPGNVAIDLPLAVLLAAACLTLRCRVRGSSRDWLPPLAALAGAAALVAGLAATPWHLPTAPYFSTQYRVVGDWLHEHGEPSDSLAATEIGYLGWYAGLRVLDIHALLHPRALPALRQANLHWWWDEGSRPRFVVSHDPPWHGEPGSEQTWPALLSAQFDQQYHEVFRHGSLRVHEYTGRTP